MIELGLEALGGDSSSTGVEEVGVGGGRSAARRWRRHINSDKVRVKWRGCKTLAKGGCIILVRWGANLAKKC
jgi:hypothetical protein